MDENPSGQFDGDHFLLNTCLSCFLFTGNVANENLKLTDDLRLDAILDITSGTNCSLDDYAATKWCC
jgi:hypothetical protein